MRWLYLILCSLSFQYLSGQFNSIDFAVEPNFCFYFSEPIGPNGDGVSINFRVPARYDLSQQFSIDTRSGLSTYKSAYEPGDSREVSTFRYISVPFYLTHVSTFNTSIYLGMEYEYLLSKSLSGEENVINLINNNHVISASLGFSYNFHGGLKFNVFYSHGLNSLTNGINVIDEEGNLTGEELVVKKSYLSIGVSYRIYKNKSVY